MVRAFKATEAIDCGGVEYTLAIDISVIDTLEDEFDLPFDELMVLFQGKVRVGRMARLVRGLLSRHHPDLTLDDVGSLAIEFSDEMGRGMERLFDKARPDQEAKVENPPKAHRGTGASSSSRGARPASRRVSSGSKRREPSFSS